MTRLGKAIFTHDFGHVVYAVVMGDRSSKKLSIDIYVVYEDGSISDIVTIPRKDIFTKKNCFDFFYDMDGDFIRDDIDKIRMAVVDILKDESCWESVQGRATLDELHQNVSFYIRMMNKGLSQVANDVFIKDKYGYMSATALDEFVKNCKELGYKRLEILRRLKIIGALQPSKGRPYDTLVSINGLKYRYYKIELADVLEDDDEEVEVIEINKREEVLEHDN